MIRLNLVLLAAVLASALYLVNVQYESRRLFSAIDKANSESRRLVSENKSLQVEKQAKATPMRVERLAKDQLHMRTATPAITQRVSQTAAADREQPQVKVESLESAQNTVGSAQ